MKKKMLSILFSVVLLVSFTILTSGCQRSGEEQTQAPAPAAPAAPSMPSETQEKPPETVPGGTTETMPEKAPSGGE